MYVQTFFDDFRLFERENLIRLSGDPKIVAVLEHPDRKTSYPTPIVLKNEQGKFCMLYTAFNTADGKLYPYLATSNDGINFEVYKKENTSLPSDVIFDLEGDELAHVILDEHADPSERYKAFICKYDNLSIKGVIKASSNLIDWHDTNLPEWNNGAEPVSCIVKNPKTNEYIITVRPTWGERRIGVKTTKDFSSYSPYEFCMQADSLDSPLDEIYGLPFFYYNGVYVGFPLIYGNLKSELSSKYLKGTIKPQLAYSINGKNWQRCLRESFIKPSKDLTKMVGFNPKMIWLLSAIEKDDGKVLLYAAVTPEEHGVEWRKPNGKIVIFELRKSGFIRLKTTRKTGTLATREFLYNGGDVSFNLKAKKATLAIYESKDGKDGIANLLAKNELISGFSHQDCLPFSGDDENYVFKFKNRDLSELKGKTLVFEIKISKGEIYSIEGDIFPMTNTESEIYRQTHILPPDRTF